MAIGTTYRLSLVGLWQGTLHVNAFHFRQREDTPGETPNTRLINDWNTHMMDVYRGMFTPAFTITQENVYVAKGSPENLSVETAFIGRYALGSEPLPTQVASVTTWLTGIAGRRFRGRSYIGGLTEQQVDSQVIDSFYRSAVDIFANRLVNTFPGVTPFDYVVYSRVAGVTTKITGYTIRSGIYTQRRRAAHLGL